MKIKLKKLFITLLLTVYCLLFIALPVLAQYEIEVSLPDAGAGTAVTLPQYIYYIYMFGLYGVGLAALGALVYGGFLYMLSGTVVSKDDAKKWIWGALSGLVLALAAYLILYTINPDLISLTPPAPL